MPPTRRKPPLRLHPTISSEGRGYIQDLLARRRSGGNISGLPKFREPMFNKRGQPIVPPRPQHVLPHEARIVERALQSHNKPFLEEIETGSSPMLHKAVAWGISTADSPATMHDKASGGYFGHFPRAEDVTGGAQQVVPSLKGALRPIPTAMRLATAAKLHPRIVDVFRGSQDPFVLREKLTALVPGLGRKTAALTLNSLGYMDVLAVDLHAQRTLGWNPNAENASGKSIVAERLSATPQNYFAAEARYAGMMQDPEYAVGAHWTGWGVRVTGDVAPHQDIVGAIYPESPYLDIHPSMYTTATLDKLRM